MISSLKRTLLEVYSLPVLVAVFTCWPLIAFGYPQGHDWIFELVRIIEYREAWASGQVIPFWAVDLYRGFGSPIFVFYAPLYSALSAALVNAGMSVTAAAVSVLVLCAVAAAIGMASLTLEVVGKNGKGCHAAARLASTAYLLMPYVLANMLVRNASAEYVALCLAPFPLWGLALIFRGGRYGLPLLTISFALVILAHNLTGLWMAALLLVTIAGFGLVEKQIKKPAIAALGLLFSIGLSCWFWLPALLMRDYVRIEDMQQGKFDFHNNFVSVWEMFRYNGFFAIGLIVPGTLIFGTIALFKGFRTRLLMSLLGAAVLLVFLQTPASVSIWENLPFLSLFQFPWRMMGPLALVSAIMLGVLFSRYFNGSRYAQIAAFLLIAANVVPLLTRYEPLSGENTQIVRSAINPAGIRRHNLPATVLDEYLPKSATKALSERTPRGAVVLPLRAIEYDFRPIKSDPTRVELEVFSEQPTHLHLARWYFPVWRASLNGEVVPVSQNDSGTVKVEIPAGRHQLIVQAKQPLERRWAMAVSSVFFSLFILVLFLEFRAENQRSKNHRD